MPKVSLKKKDKSQPHSNSDSQRARNLMIMTKFIINNKGPFNKDKLQKGDGMARLMFTREEMQDIRHSFDFSEGNSLFNASI